MVGTAEVKPVVSRFRKSPATAVSRAVRKSTAAPSVRERRTMVSKAGLAAIARMNDV